MTECGYDPLVFIVYRGPFCLQMKEGWRLLQAGPETDATMDVSASPLDWLLENSDTTRKQAYRLSTTHQSRRNRTKGHLLLLSASLKLRSWVNLVNWPTKRATDRADNG